MKLLFEKSIAGRSAATFPSSSVKPYVLPESIIASEPPALPELSEVDVVRHFTALARRAFGVDDGFYPLGSCTMKYNPKVNERVAAFPGFTDIHPLQDASTCQGALALMFELSQQFRAITGMEAFTLQPAAGAHGEFTGLKIIRAYHLDAGHPERNIIIVPDSAHGTNPASAALAGLKIVNIKSAPDGSVDLDALRAAVGPSTAALMLTNPNTLGLFDRNITEITKIVHDAGGLCYYDGANLNAVMGIARPADMGFDVVHLNLHKTFSTPHGAGGPGSGPVGCVEKLASFLPGPIVTRQNGSFAFTTPAKSIGKVRSFFGNFLICVRAYCYILTLGRDGIKDASQKAVLNANYLKALLPQIDHMPDRICMHEFTCSLSEFHDRYGVSALDVAKAMIDHGIHPPTIYFPLIVHEAMMFEPTETETKETLDDAAKIVLLILAKAMESGGPEYLHRAPINAQCFRPDDTLAARSPVLRWTRQEATLPQA